MAISGGDGSIILTTKIDQNGLKSGLKGMTSLVTKSFAVIGAAAATATVAITKMATDAYADYEQLVGGVETLFKGSAGKVLEYANQAFATTGQSANEYMRNVTAFSASLLSAVGGDTEKAAEVANAAMISISDNVNKMGSSAESVQLAFQGFAKQQYMLLDNLKLGYGGTKTEMERLLKDAQAITGVKYDISNLADVYTAIGVIQEKLGIAGTTAKEAESTISGSAAMMKAAWENVLAAVAGGGDLDVAINNLVYSIQKYFENIVPVVERSLVGIGRLIEKIAPMLVRNVASALIQAIPSLINAVYQMIVGLAKGIWQGIKALFTGGSGSVTADIKTSVGGIATETENASTGMEELGDATEEAGKQAKKSLAAFDDLNILSSGAGGAGKTPEIATGGIGGASVPTVESTMDIKAEETGEQATWLSERLAELTDAFSGVKDIDLTNLSNSLGLLKDPLQGLAEIAWEAILWGIEEVITPLTGFAIKTVLPNFIEKLSDRFRELGNVLKKAKPFLESFNNNFLKPIMAFAVTEILSFWESFNSSLEKIEQKLSNSELWKNITIVFEFLYKILVPVIQSFLWLGDLITNIVTQHAFNNLETIISDLTDTFGFLAAIIQGDFSKAWDHLKNLLIDNRIEDVKQDMELLKTAFSNIIDPIKNMSLEFKNSVDDMVEKWQTKMSAWWTDDVEPWFTKEKWEQLFFKIGESLANAIIGVNGFVEKWKTNITNWWNDDVSPWFTISKWKELFDNIVTSTINFFTAEDGFVQTWRTRIAEWWNGDVVPWFTLEKWKELGGHIKDGLIAGFNGAVNGIRGIINKILDGFQGLVNGAIDMMNSLIDGYNKVANVTALPSISKISRADLSKYKLPMLAQGTVVPPNREFMAILGDNTKEHEIVSPVSTMKQAFTEAMAEMGAMGQTTKEEHYYLSETELMSVIYKLVKGGERLKGNSLISGGAY